MNNINEQVKKPENFPEKEAGIDLRKKYFDNLAAALESDEYEVAERALRKVRQINEFHEAKAASRFRDFYDLVERAHYISVLGGKQKKYLRQILANEATLHLNKLTPRVRDIYRSLIAVLSGEKPAPEKRETEKLLSALEEEGVLNTLTTGKASLSTRQNNLEKQLLTALKGLRRLDMREGFQDNLKDKSRQKPTQERLEEHSQEQSEKQSEDGLSFPPSVNDESQPGVDPSERPEKNEKEPNFWEINPGWSGYYQEKTFGKWDESAKKWVGDAVLSDRVVPAPLLEKESEEKFNIKVRAVLQPGQQVCVPVPYTHAYHGVESAGDMKVSSDQYGNIYLQSEQGGEVAVTLAYVGQRIKKDLPKDVAYFDGKLSEKTQQKLAEIKETFRTDEERARALAAYVVSTLKYFKPENNAEAEKFNEFCRTHPEGFAFAVEEAGKGDCDVVNTYYALLCAKIGLHARHIVGHSVSGKDKKTGVSAIHSGTGHAWTEVWSKERSQWLRIDATPPGDPNLEGNESDESSEQAPGDFGEETPSAPDEQGEKKGETGESDENGEGNESGENGEQAPGDFGEETPSEPDEQGEVNGETDEIDESDETGKNDGDDREEQGGFGGEWTDEKLKELEKELQKRVFELSYTAQERQIAEETGIELKEARQVMNEIKKAEQLTLPSGERIKDVMMSLFSQIVQARRKKYRVNRGPVTQAMGGTRIMPGRLVQHVLQSRASIPDPQTRLRRETKEKKEDLFGGFDVFFVGDNSASTDRLMGEEGMKIYELQRLAGYLIFSALHDFEKELESKGVVSLSPEESLDINTMGISYHGDEEVKVDKKFGKKFTAQDKVRMWHSLQDIEAGFGADAALGFLAEKIEKDLSGKSSDNRLRLVIFCSDGEFFDEETIQVKAQLDRLKSAGAVVVGIGLTEEAENIPVIFQSAGCRGDYTAELDDLPKIIAKHIVMEAVRLFPEKAKDNLRQTIDNILRKFDQN